MKPEVALGKQSRNPNAQNDTKTTFRTHEMGSYPLNKRELSIRKCNC
jgi:hypothetical protein